MKEDNRSLKQSYEKAILIQQNCDHLSCFTIFIGYFDNCPHLRYAFNYVNNTIPYWFPDLCKVPHFGTQVQVKVLSEKSTQVQVKVLFSERIASKSKSTFKST